MAKDYEKVYQKMGRNNLSLLILGVAATRIPAASKEDSRPQAILKVHPPSSLYYRARHGLPVALYVYIELFRIVKTLLQNNFVGE